MSAAPDQPAWDLFPHFVLRRAGFAFDLVEELGLSASVQSLRALAEADARIDHALAGWNATTFPVLLARAKAMADKAPKKALDRTTTAARRRTLPGGEDWEAARRLAGADLGPALDAFAAAVADRALFNARFQAEFTSDFGQAREALRRASQGVCFRDALDQLNADLDLAPKSEDAGQARNSATRQREQVLFKYLQRLCAKNETNSFFGPVHYGRIEAAGQGLAIDSRWSEQPVERAVFFSHWLVEDVARAIASDSRLADVVPLVPAPSRRRQGDESRPARGSVREIAETCGIPQEVARADAAGGAWRRSLVPAPSRIHQLAALASDLRALKVETPAEIEAAREWSARLAAFLDDGHRLANERDLETRKAIRAGIERRYAELTEGATKRHAGRMFRTRRVVYEDGWVPFDATLAADEADELRSALAPILDTGLFYARLLDARLEAEAAGVARAWFGAEVRTLSYDRFIAAWHGQGERPRPLAAATAARLDELDQAIAAFDGLWTDALDEIAADASARWPIARFAALVDAAAPRGSRDAFAIASPDILPFGPGAAPGVQRWVLGEVHHGATLDGWMLSFHPDAAQIGKALREAFALSPGAEGVRANLVMARQMKTAPQEYPGLRVEWSANAAAGGDGPVLGVRDLVVRLDGDTLELIEPEQGRRLRFYPPAFGFDARAYAPFGLFSLPILRLPKRSARKRHPRATYRGLVVARAEWSFDAQDAREIVSAPDLPQAMLAAHRARDAAGMPRHTFLRCASEPKPLHLDWLNPFAIELLRKLARSGERLIFSEMLPGSQELWLEGKAGRCTSELRFVMTRRV